VILGAIVDVHDLLTVVWVSAVASLVLVIATSVAIVGASRATTLRREGQPATAVLFGTLALLAAAVCAGGVVLAVSVMLAK
jgi:hypothetical protein